MPRAASHDEPMTEESLKEAILYLAECVVAHGEKFAPFLDKLEAELARMQAKQDPRSRALAILARHRQSAAGAAGTL